VLLTRCVYKLNFSFFVQTYLTMQNIQTGQQESFECKKWFSLNLLIYQIDVVLVFSFRFSFSIKNSTANLLINIFRTFMFHTEISFFSAFIRPGNISINTLWICFNSSEKNKNKTDNNQTTKKSIVSLSFSYSTQPSNSIISSLIINIFVQIRI